MIRRIIKGIRNEAYLIERKRRIDAGKSMLDVMVVFCWSFSELGCVQTQYSQAKE